MAYTMDYPTRQLFYQWLDQKELDNVCFNKLGTIPFANSNSITYQVPLASSNNPYFGNNKCIGIDIPVLIHPESDKNNGQTLVIVGQSAQRDKNSNCSTKHALVGCPFAVSHIMSKPSQCDVYKLIFGKLLNLGYNLYITDAIKMWWTDKRPIFDSKDKDIFLEEINQISENNNIKAIITWGKTAEYFVKSLPIGKNHQPNIIHLMHPGILNWDRWKLSLFEEAVYNNNPQLASQYYPNNNTSSSADIVSDLVVRKILKAITVVIINTHANLI